ncbi:hypothetical protein OCU04_005800 [Sclerotinia nivalis]|uniref:Uncharacterized protein n=1 Tax=Sclerotinia nivalis TaxID=352851 RepID=A0A9X0DKL6_9HELO|nr:hypothetical protein OCU04_005800 [Sclerotinia nivalis]
MDCTIVEEKTTCFETFLYADPGYRTTVTDEDVFRTDELEDFLYSKSKEEIRPLELGTCSFLLPKDRHHRCLLQGTPRPDGSRCIACLRKCVGEIDHPLFLPTLVFFYNNDFLEDKRHGSESEFH